MIVDVHSHTPEFKDPVPESLVQYQTTWRPDRPVRWPVSWADYMEAMEPVSKAVVFGIAGLQREADDEPGEPLATEMRWKGNVNDLTSEFASAFPERLIGFMSVHPRDPGCLEEIDRSFSDLGLKGIKLAPNYQNFDPTSSEAFAVYERASSLGLPILFHTGTSPDRYAPLDYAHPRHFDRIAITFPDLRMVLAHMSHPWQTTCIAVIRKHPNVYADISGLFYRPWSFYSCMRLAEEWGVLQKLLFATDYPATAPQENIDALSNINRIVKGTQLPLISEHAIEQIINRDALHLLGLD